MIKDYEQITITDPETKCPKMCNIFENFGIFRDYIILNIDRIGDEIGSEIEILIESDNEFYAEDVYCRCEEYTDQIREELINEATRFLNENGLISYCKDVI